MSFSSSDDDSDSSSQITKVEAEHYRSFESIGSTDFETTIESDQPLFLDEISPSKADCSIPATVKDSDGRGHHDCSVKGIEEDDISIVDFLTEALFNNEMDNMSFDFD